MMMAGAVEVKQEVGKEEQETGEEEEKKKQEEVLY